MPKKKSLFLSTLTQEEREAVLLRIRQRSVELLQSEPVQHLDVWVAKIRAAPTNEEACAFASAMVRRYVLRDREISALTQYELAT